MSIVTKFRGQSELSAEENLAKFIKYATEHSLFVGVDQAKNTWDITKFVMKKNRGHQSSNVYFNSWRDQSGSTTKKTEFMCEPFLSFAKATFNELMRRRARVVFERIIVALQAIEQALLDLNLEPSVVNVSNHVLDVAASRLKDRFKNPWSQARHLEIIANEIIESGRLSTVVIQWRSPFNFGKPPRNDVVNHNSVEDVAKDRLPDPRAVLALGDVHSKSDHLPDRVLTSFVALAIFAPSRASEILTLPESCITSQSADGEAIMGIRWQPAKGGQAMTKFAVSKSSEELAREAIQFLSDLGKQTREAARWYTFNPDKLYLPPGMEHLRGMPLTLWEVTQILGKDTQIRACRVTKGGYEFDRAIEDRTTDQSRMDPTRKNGYWTALYSFESVERYVLGRLSKTFPILDDQTNLLWMDALFCLPAGVMRPHAEILRHVPESLTVNVINNQMGSNVHGITVFTRNNKFDDNGNPWVITSHQFRHLLNTLAQSKYLSESLIAFWSGRQSVKQNEWYNHLPQEAFIEAYLKLEEFAPKIDVIGPLNDKVTSQAASMSITYDQALKLEIGSIHITRYGLCRHDYALTPCPKDKDCINCGEHYVVKGDERHLNEAKLQVKLHMNAVHQCNEAIQNGEIGVQKYLDRHQERLDRWQETLRMLEDPEIPAHTIITLQSPRHSQAKSGLAHNVRHLKGGLSGRRV